MESAVIPYSRLREKNKWVYSAHSQLSLQIEEHLNSTQFDVVTLGTLVKEIADGLHGVRHYVNDGVVMLAVGNVTEYGLDLSDQKLVTKEEHERLKRSQVQRGDLLVTITGRLGSTLVYESDEPANLSAHVARVKINEEAVNPYYLAAYLNSKVGKQLIDEFSIGSIYPHINVNRLKNVRVVLPPRSLQDQIAQVMQEAYRDRQKKLEEANTLFKSMDEWALQNLQVALNNLQEEKYFTIPLKNLYGKRWDVFAYQPAQLDLTDSSWISLHEYVQVLRNTKNLSKNGEQEFCYVAIQGMNNDPYSSDENAVLVQGKEVQGIAQEFRGGDILLARLAPCLANKKSVLVPETRHLGYGSPEFLVIRPKNGIDPRFILWLIKSEFLLTQMLPKTTGATPSRMRLHAEELLQLRVPKADTSQQKFIGAELERRRSEAKRLRNEAEAVVTAAKARVERMILGEEKVSEN